MHNASCESCNSFVCTSFSVGRQAHKHIHKHIFCHWHLLPTASMCTLCTTYTFIAIIIIIIVIRNEKPCTHANANWLPFQKWCGGELNVKSFPINFERGNSSSSSGTDSRVSFNKMLKIFQTNLFVHETDVQTTWFFVLSSLYGWSWFNNFSLFHSNTGVYAFDVNKIHGYSENRSLYEKEGQRAVSWVAYIIHAHKPS